MRGSLKLILLVTFAALQSSAVEPTHDVQSNGYITQWLLCGPFPNPGSSERSDTVTRAGFHTDFLAKAGAETGCRPTAGQKVEYDGTTCAFVTHAGTATYVDFNTVFRREYAVAYVYTTLVSAVETTAYMHLGADDGVKVFVNGAIVYEHFATRGMREHDDIFEVKLVKGENPLLIKVDQGHGGWSLVAQLLDRPSHEKWVKQEVARTATIRIEQHGKLGSELTLVADPGFETFGVIDDVATRWQVVGPAGDTIATAEGTFAKPGKASLSTGAGFYTVRMQSPSIGILREARCLLSKDPAKQLAVIVSQAHAWLAAPSQQACAGMVAYQLSLLQEAIAAGDSSSSDAVYYAGEVRRWLTDAREEPQALLRGTFEWAYRSNVDNTGQPFTMRVPQQYDPLKAWPLHIYLHGNGGTHNAPNRGENPPFTEPYLYMTPLGRARGGGYDKLSEVDVLEAIAYVRAHWNVDPQRIHLSGGSMGGGGTFKLASRHPHLFASATPVCGYGTTDPVDNMQHVPVYSYHSTDDWVVPVVSSRLPVLRLAALGGRSIQDEVSGYGHGVGRCKDCEQRAWVWRAEQVRPAEVREIRYTALDEGAVGAYWARIMEWGPNPDAASFTVRLGVDNGIYLTSKNVGILALDLASSPADRSKTMAVVYAGKLDTVLAAPLPDTLYLAATQHGLVAVQPLAPKARRHFPGGLPAMLHGEPLMVVYGTKGNARVDSLLKAQADVLKYTVRGQFAVEKPGQRHETMLSGMIACKSDRDVTEGDIATHSLILLGTAAQNSVVTRIAEKLPVRIVDGTVIANDGFSWSFKGRCLGLLYHNPLAPQRLVYWLATDQLKSVESGRAVLDLQMWAPCGPDLIVIADSGRGWVANRYFAPDWSWQKGYGDSPLVPTDLQSAGARCRLRAQALLAATNADFVQPDRAWGDTTVDVSPGETRLIDTRESSGGIPSVMFALRGDTLLAHTGGSEPELTLYPKPDSATIVPDRLYTVATAIGWGLSDYCGAVQWTPDSSWYVDVDAQEAYDLLMRRAANQRRVLSK